jgi:hypothetical protein
MADQPKRLNERRRFPEWRLDIEGAVSDDSAYPFTR